MSTKPDHGTLPAFYKGYVSLVEDMDVIDALKRSAETTYLLLESIPAERQDYRYEDGKWSIRELLVHLLDSERVFAYRALSFSRNDQTELPGFEQNDWVPQSNAGSRDINIIIEMMRRLRGTTIDLFEGFSSEMLLRSGVANGNKISVVNLGYVIAGHETHHRRILSERYIADKI